MAERIEREILIFLSSPTDVRPERERAERVVAQIQGELGDVARLVVIRWEHQGFVASRDFQSQIREAADCDVVVCVLWSRLGTPLAESRVRPDGTLYPSGTAYELETALAAADRAGGALPAVLVYRKAKKVAVEDVTDEAATSAARDSVRSLDEYFRSVFLDRQGSFVRAYHTFASTDEFEHLLENHLRERVHEILRERRIAASAVRWDPAIQKEGPFRGLLAFEEHHAPIFFGRSRETADAVKRISDSASRGTPFLLVLGASGTGKSSLARAGILPRLTQIGVVPSVDVWRTCTLKPSEGTGDPLAALAQRLFAEPRALPELAEGDHDALSLTRLLRTDPESALVSVGKALDRAAESARANEGGDRPFEARLLLLVDQLEELFAADVHATEFARALRVLVGSGRVWAIATLRSDLYAGVQANPDLLALKDAGATLDVVAPGPAALREIIREPAKAAGLRYGVRESSGEALDEEIARAAEGAKGVLPLLEFTLNALFDDRDATTGELRVGTYDAIGGLAGAIAQKAEETFNSLEDPAKQAIDRVASALVNMKKTDDGEYSPAARPVLADTFSTDTYARAFVDAFYAQRLFVKSVDRERRPTVALAHDALLTHWPALERWVVHNREDLLVRERIEEEAKLWRDEGKRADLLLQAGKPLDDGRRIARVFGSALPDDVLPFVAASEADARRAQRLWRVAKGTIGVLFVALIGLAITAVVSAWRAQDLLAEQFTDRSELARKASDSGLALLWLERAIDETPFLSGAGRNRRMEFALRAREFWTPDAIISGRLVALSPSDDRMLVASQENALQLWDTGAWILVGADLVSAAPPREGCTHLFSNVQAGFCAGGSRVVTWASASTLQLWDAHTSAAIGKPMAALCADIVLSDDGTRLATAVDDHLVQIWDTRTAEAVGLPLHALARYTDFSTDGTQLFTRMDHVRPNEIQPQLWDARTGAAVRPEVVFGGQTRRYRVNERAADDVSRDGTRALTQVGEDEIELWDARTAVSVGKLRSLFSGVDAHFSPDGTRLVTRVEKEAVQLWDARTGEGVGKPLHAPGQFQRGRDFSPDGTHFITPVGESMIQMWDARTGAACGDRISSDASAWKGDFLLTENEEGEFQLWGCQGNPKSAPLTIPGPTDIQLTDVRVLPNGFVAVASKDTVHVFERASGQHLVAGDPGALRFRSVDGKTWERTFSLPDHFKGYRLLGRDDLRVIAFNDEEIVVFGLPMESAPAGPLDGVILHSSALFAGPHGQEPPLVPPNVGFSPDGSKVISLLSGKIRFWNSVDGTASGDAIGETISSLSFSPGGRWVLSNEKSGRRHLRDAATGAPVGAGLPASEDDPEVSFAIVSQDGDRLMSFATDPSYPPTSHHATIWESVKSQQPVRGDTLQLLDFVLVTSNHVVTVAGVPSNAPSEAYALAERLNREGHSEEARNEFERVQGGGSEVRVWDVRSLRLLNTFEHSTARIDVAMTTADEVRLLSGAPRHGSGRVKIFDPITGLSRMTEGDYGEVISTIKRGAMGFDKRDQVDIQVRSRWAGHNQFLDARVREARSPDGGLVFSVDDGTASIEIRDSKSGRVLGNLPDGAELAAVVVDPSGDRVLAIRADGTLRARRLCSATLPSDARTFVELVAGRSLTEDGVHVLSAQDVSERLRMVRERISKDRGEWACLE